jgi:hypothetical protein
MATLLHPDNIKKSEKIILSLSQRAHTKTKATFCALPFAPGLLLQLAFEFIPRA